MLSYKHITGHEENPINRSEHMQSVFLALAGPTRRLIIQRLLEEAAATATRLAAGLSITRQAVTRHLNTLVEAGLLTSRVVLRTLETAGVEVILCRGFDEDGLGLAIRDRLLRAAAGKVFKYPPSTVN